MLHIKQKSVNTIYTAAFIAIAVFLIVFRLHNAVSFNPYWGYDGGAHLDYIFSVAQTGQIPSIQENTVAWHEPLYYFLQAGYLKIVMIFTDDIKILLKSLSVAQAVLSLATSALLLLLLKHIVKNKIALITSFTLLSLLPPFTEASTFITNELLNNFFILLLLVLFFYKVSDKQLTRRDAFVLGAIAGLAMLTKITSIIVISIIAAYLIYRAFLEKSRATIANAIIFILLVVLFAVPWQIYRAQNILPSPTINNPVLLEPRPLAFDERVKFYTFFDTDIYKFPMWYSGGRAFWSMIYADSFYDYYGIMENDDLIEQTAKENLVRTSVSDTYVSRRNFSLSSYLVWLALIPATIAILGIIAMIARARKKEIEPIFGLVVSFAFFCALLYFSYRYPYPDQGIVKSIFIYPAYIFPIAYGLDGKMKSIIFTPLLLAYIITLAMAFWVTKFNY